MNQVWQKHPEIKNDKDEPLIWPEGVIPVPKSHEVAFLVARFHTETGEDINWDVVSSIASHIAAEHLKALKEDETDRFHWQGYLEATQVVTERQRARANLDEQMRELISSDLEELRSRI